MSIVARVKNIILTPKSEWPVIAAEPATTAGLLAGYVAPLAAIGILAGFVGHSIIGYSMPFMGTVRMPIIAGLSVAVFSYIMVFIGVFIIAAIVNALAPTFGGQKDFLAALKVTVYAQTPGWVAGVLSIIPLLGILVLIAMLYGLYLLYLGLPVLMKNPEDKSIGYTAVTVICAIVVYVVVGVLATAVTGLFGGALLSGMGGMGSGMGGMGSGRSSEVIIDKNSSLGKLQEFGKKMEEQGRKMDEANKSGDTQAATKAAGDVLGTLLGGGKRIEPLQIEEIKPFVPETFGGLARKSNKTERSGFAGVQVTKAEAGYGDDSGKYINLEVTDTGGIGGLMMFAGWANVQGEKEDENSKEVTRKDGGRLIHEKVSKTGGTNEFDIVIGDRFLVGARGRGGVTLDQLKSAVATLDLAKLESMKDVGVQK